MKQLQGMLSNAFEELKRSSNEVKRNLESRDAEMKKLSEEVKAMSGRMDQAETKSNRTPLFAAQSSFDRKDNQSAEMKAFVNFLRGKATADEIKALSVGTDTSGGYLVPDDFRTEIIKAQTEYGVMRRLARRIETSSSSLLVPKQASGVSVAWIDENSAIPESDPALGQDKFTPHKLAGLTRTSNELLEDSAVDVSSFLSELFGESLGTEEDSAFFNGNGTDKPTGLLNGSTVTRVETATAATLDDEDIVSLFYKLPAPYRRNGSFVVSSAIEEQIRKLKDNNGNYLWVNSLAAGAPPTLLGRPIYNVEELSDTVATGEDVMIFGDFRYYWIVDRTGIEVQRSKDRYFENDQTAFKVVQRVDGKVVLPNAFRILRVK